MGASSVTGTGLGVAGKPNSGELAILAQGPTVVWAGTIITEEELITSPPICRATLTLPIPLEGGASHYAIMLTPLGNTTVWLEDTDNNSAGEFEAFIIGSDDEVQVQFAVIRKGIQQEI